MTYTITKDFEFSASHQLNSLPNGHKCKRLHGHNYVVTIGLERETLADHRMVVDYGDLDPIGDWIKDKLDHQHLNNILSPLEATAESLAVHIYSAIAEGQDFEPFANMNPVVAEVLGFVTVCETPHTSATYRNDLKDRRKAQGKSWLGV